jgi:hypothetical protein
MIDTILIYLMQVIKKETIREASYFWIRISISRMKIGK